MNIEQNFKLYIDREVVDKVNFKKKDLLCLMAISLDCYKNASLYGTRNVEYIYHTPETLWRNMMCRDASRAERKKFLEGLIRLEESNLIKIFPKNPQEKIMWNTFLEIEVQNVFHKESNSFISTDSFDVNDMFVDNYNTSATLLQVYISIVSYFNMEQIRYFDECIKEKKNPIDYNYDLYGEIDLHISCWASHDRLMTTKHSSDKIRQQWITKPTLIKALKLLEELNLISIIKVHNGEENFTNHYCFTRHKKYVKQIANRTKQQLIYARKR